jgi:hypothetical protein
VAFPNSDSHFPAPALRFRARFSDFRVGFGVAQPAFSASEGGQIPTDLRIANSRGKSTMSRAVPESTHSHPPGVPWPIMIAVQTYGPVVCQVSTTSWHHSEPQMRFFVGAVDLGNGRADHYAVARDRHGRGEYLGECRGRRMGSSATSVSNGSGTLALTGNHVRSGQCRRRPEMSIKFTTSCAAVVTGNRYRQSAFADADRPMRSGGDTGLVFGGLSRAPSIWVMSRAILI